MSSNVTLHGKHYQSGNILPIAINSAGELIIDSGGAIDLANLGDVSIAGLANNNLLQYDGTVSYWVNRNSLGGNIGFESQYTTQTASFNNVWVSGFSNLSNLSAGNLSISGLSNLANVGISANLDVLGHTGLGNLSVGNISVIGLSNLANVGVSANLDVLGHTGLGNLSVGNLVVSGLSNLANVGISANLDVLGHTGLGNLSVGNLVVSNLSNLANVGVSGNLDVLGHTGLSNLSVGNLVVSHLSNLANVGISANLDVLGHTGLGNLSVGNISVSGLSNLANVGISSNLDVLGHTGLANLSVGNLVVSHLSNLANVGVSGNLDVLGHTGLGNLSVGNLVVSHLSNLANVGVSGNLDVLGHTGLGNLSVGNLVVSNRSNLTNVGISANLDVLGHTGLGNLSVGNLEVSGTANISGNTTLNSNLLITGSHYTFFTDSNTYIHGRTAGANLDITNLAGNVNIRANTDIILTTNTGSTIKMVGPTEQMLAVSEPSTGNIYMNFGANIGDLGYGIWSDNGVLKRKNDGDPGWVELSSGTGGASNLANLSDVQFALPLANNEILAYDSTLSKWTNSTLGNIVAELGYYGVFYDNTTQDNIPANTSRAMKCNTTAEAKGVSVDTNGVFTVDNAGVYNIQFSAQLTKTDSGNDIVDIWFRKNGSNIAESNTEYTVVGNNGRSVAALNYVLTLAANNTIEIMWRAADSQISLLHQVATSNVPAIPSVIVTITPVQYIQDGTLALGDLLNVSTTGQANNHVLQYNSDLNRWDTRANLTIEPGSLAIFGSSANIGSNAATGNLVINAGNLEISAATGLTHIHNNLLVSGNLSVSGLSNLAYVGVSGNLDVLGHTGLANLSAANLVVSHLSNLANVGVSGNLDVLGHTGLGNLSVGNISVSRLSNLANVGISGSLDVLGHTGLGNLSASNLIVSHLSNLANVGISGNLDVLGHTGLGNLSVGNISVSGLSNLANVGVSGNLDVLGHTGLANLSASNLVVSHLSNLANVGISGGLDVQGQSNLSNVSAGNLVVLELSNLANVGISGSLDVLGTSNLSNVSAGNLVVLELSNLANVGISGGLDVQGQSNLSNVSAGNLVVLELSNLANVGISGSLDVLGQVILADVSAGNILITDAGKLEFRDTTTYIQSAGTGNLDIWATDGNINITANNDIVLTANATSTIKLIGAGANSLASFSNDGGANTTITLGQGNTNIIYLDAENMVLEQRNTGNLVISAEAISGEYLTQTINPIFDGQVGNIAIGGNVITYTSNTISRGYFAYKKTTGTSWTTPPVATTGNTPLVFDQSSSEANVNINLVSNNRKIKFNKSEYNNFNLFRDGYIEFTTGTPSDKFKFLNISNFRSAYPTSDTYYGWASITNPDDALVITYQDLAVQKVDYPPPEYNPVYSNLGNINLQVVLYSNNSPLYGTYDVSLGLCQGDANLSASYYGEIYGIPYSSTTSVPLSSYPSSFQTSQQYTDTYQITGRYNPQLNITNTAPLANGSIYTFSSNTQTTNKFGVKKWLGQKWTTQPPYVPNSATVISPLSGTPTNIDLGAAGRTIEYNQQTFSNIWINNLGAINFGGQYSSNDKLGVFNGLTLTSYPTTNIYYGFTSIDSTNDTLVITYSDVGYDYSGTTYGNLYTQVALFSNASPKSGTYELNYGVVSTDTANTYSYYIGAFGNSTNGNSVLSVSTIPYEFGRIPAYNTIIRKGDVDISFPIDVEQDASYLNFGASKGLYGIGFRTIDNHDGYGTRFQFSTNDKGNWHNFINGNDGEVIFNDNGDYTGSYDLRYNKTTTSLLVAGNVYAQSGGFKAGYDWATNPPTMNSAGLFYIPLANLSNAEIGNLAVSGVFSLNDISVPGNLSVIGDSNLGNVSVGNLTITGAFSLNDIAVPGNLSVVGISNLGNVEVGNLVINGAFSLNDITVPGNLSVLGYSNLANVAVGNIQVLDAGRIEFRDGNTFIQSIETGNLDIKSLDGNINITANHDIILTANSPSTVRLVGPGNAPIVAFNLDAGGNAFMSFGALTGDAGYGIKADSSGNVLLKSLSSPEWGSVGNTQISIAGRTVALGGSNTIGFEDLTGSIDSSTQITMGSIGNDKLTNSSLTIGTTSISLGGSSSIGFGDITGSIDTVNQVSMGSIGNDRLTNDSITIGMTSISLGGSSSIGFSDITGSIDTVNQVSMGSIGNDRLTNDSITIGMTSISLGGSSSIGFSDITGSIDTVNQVSMGSIGNDRLTNDSITIAGQLVSLGGSASIGFNDLSGSLNTDTQIDAGNIANTKLANSNIVIGGQTISLGGSGSLGFSNITGSLDTGTQIDNGNIANIKLANSNIVIGGQTINLGGSGSLAFSNITGNISVTQIDPASITNAQLAGSITNSKLANSNIVIGGQTINLGGSGNISFSNLTGTVDRILFTSDKINLGVNTGTASQNSNAIAIGYNTGYSGQKNNAIAIGSGAGFANQGVNSIAIGYNAGSSSQANNTIVLSASGDIWSTSTANAFYVKPVRNSNISNVNPQLYYNTTSGEITYNTRDVYALSMYGNISVNFLNTSTSTSNKEIFSLTTTYWESQPNIPTVTSNIFISPVGDTRYNYTTGIFTLTNTKRYLLDVNMQICFAPGGTGTVPAHIFNMELIKNPSSPSNSIVSMMKSGVAQDPNYVQSMIPMKYIIDSWDTMKICLYKENNTASTADIPSDCQVVLSLMEI
jgi:hypothetical protein